MNSKTAGSILVACFALTSSVAFAQKARVEIQKTESKKRLDIEEKKEGKKNKGLATLDRGVKDLERLDGAVKKASKVEAKVEPKIGFRTNFKIDAAIRLAVREYVENDRPRGEFSNQTVMFIRPSNDPKEVVVSVWDPNDSSLPMNVAVSVERQGADFSAYVYADLEDIVSPYQAMVDLIPERHRTPGVNDWITREQNMKRAEEARRKVEVGYPLFN